MRRHAVSGRAALGARDRRLGLRPGQFQLAHAAQDVAERQRHRQAVGPRLLGPLERRGGLFQPSRPRQQLADAVVDGAQLGMRLDDALQRVDRFREPAFTDQPRGAGVRVEDRGIRHHGHGRGSGPRFGSGQEPGDGQPVLVADRQRLRPRRDAH